MDKTVIFTYGIFGIQVCILLYSLTLLRGARRNYSKSLVELDNVEKFNGILQTEIELLHSAQSMRDCEYTIEDGTVLIKFKSYKKAREFEDSVWKKKHELKFIV